MPQDHQQTVFAVSRRGFLQAGGSAAASVAAGGCASNLPPPAATPPAAAAPTSVAPRPVALRINGRQVDLMLEPRVTLLDALREYAGMPGTKKGCDRGQCGACTVMIDGRRINACLTLAVMQEGAEITTIEGLGRPAALHPMQAAFIERDAFQCGYCTPGQICSAVALVAELKAGTASAATPDVRARVITISDDEIRERMSGNLCRCGAYPNIVAAVRQVATDALAAAPRAGIEEHA